MGIYTEVPMGAVLIRALGRIDGLDHVRRDFAGAGAQANRSSVVADRGLHMGYMRRCAQMASWKTAVLI